MKNAHALFLTALASAMRPRKRLTVSEWADAHRVLSSKGSSEAGNWKTSRTPYLEEIMDVLSERSPVQRVVLMFAAQLGKALALDTPVPTPEGWTTMGELKAGDRVLDEAGRPCSVIYVTEVMDKRECYRITFSDGAEIVADADHQWFVHSDLSLQPSRGKRGGGH